MAFDKSITADTPIYAVFFVSSEFESSFERSHTDHTGNPQSGLQKLPVQVRITRGNADYKIDTIPAGIAGQVYVVLSRSCTDFSDENVIAGPAILEVSPLIE